MQILAITPEQFDPAIHSLPTAGELLLPGMQVTIQSDGIALGLRQTIIKTDLHGIVIELSKAGDLVEVAVTGEQQDDGGYYFEQVWVVSD